jgi:hypothetical protein
MKIAVLLSGQPRLTNDFDIFLNNLVGYDQADWFIYLTNNNKNRGMGHGATIADPWLDYDPEWARDKFVKNLPKNNYIRSFDISDCYSKTWPSVTNLYHCHDWMVELVFMMNYNINKVNQHRLEYQKQTGVEYDVIVKARTDVGLKDTLDITTLMNNPDTIIMPDKDWYGVGQNTANDQLVFGDSNSMNHFSTLIHHLKEYNLQGLNFHPETLLAYHLRKNNIKLLRGNFKISLREFPIDKSKWC